MSPHRTEDSFHRAPCYGGVFIGMHPVEIVEAQDCMLDGRYSLVKAEVIEGIVSPSIRRISAAYSCSESVAGIYLDRMLSENVIERHAGGFRIATTSKVTQ